MYPYPFPLSEHMTGFSQAGSTHQSLDRALCSTLHYNVFIHQSIVDKYFMVLPLSFSFLRKQTLTDY